MKCINKNCQKEIPEDSQFCYLCGTKQPERKKCSKCKCKNIASDALFCPECGTRLNDHKNWDQLKIGDYYYSDGTFSSLPDQTKVCVGIVFSLETTPAEKKHGWTHGQIVALKDAGEEGFYRWGPDIILPAPHVMCTKSIDAKLDRDGFLYSNSDLVSGKEYEAFVAAREYSVELPLGQTSGWYLPSVGQWVEIIENLGKISITGDDDGDYLFFDDDMGDCSDQVSLLDFDDWYWSSTEYNASSSWLVGASGVLSNHKSSLGQVRPVSAF